MACCINQLRAHSLVLALALAPLTACGPDGSSSSASGSASTPAPTPSSSPTPSPSTAGVQYVATPVPFGLTASRSFDVLGWDSWPASPTPTTVQFRWNATTGKYEILEPVYAVWGHLEHRQDSTGMAFDVFKDDGTKLPFFLPLGTVYPYVGDARIFEGTTARSFFAFGIATAAGDVTSAGTKICSFATDEIGSGEIIFDLGAGTATGWVEPFWYLAGQSLPRYPLQTSFARGATTFSATFGSGGVLDGQFFGPQAVNIAVRVKGGGTGFGAVSGILTGTCQG